MPDLSYKTKNGRRGGFPKRNGYWGRQKSQISVVMDVTAMSLLEHWPHCHQKLKLFLSSPRICECPWGKVSAQGLALGLCLRDTTVLPSSPSQPKPSLHSVCVLAIFGKTLTLATAVAARVCMAPDPCPIPLAQYIPITRGSGGPSLSPCHLCDFRKVPSLAGFQFLHL